jgi:ADP-heptose:LPS heptosyltransferase
MHPGALGDLVLAFPLLRRLRRAHGALDLLCQEAVGALAVHLGVADRRFSLESARFSGLYQDRIADSALSAFLAGHDHFLVFAQSDAPARAARTVPGLDVHRVPPRPPVSERIHVADYLEKRLRRRGFPLPEIPADAPRRGPSPCGGAPVLLHPGSGGARKNWPLDRFRTVFERLRSAGMSPRFLLGPAESFLTERLGDVGPATTPENLVALADILKTAEGVIGNDSGVSHLAAFLGVPTAAVFGPSDPVRWRPAGPAVEVVGGGAECAPCFEAEPRPECGARECLGRVSPDQAIAAFRKAVRRGRFS